MGAIKPMGLLSALVQLGDFIWKACVSYSSTPEGQKELNDVAKALGINETAAEQSVNRPTQPNKRV